MCFYGIFYIFLMFLNEKFAMHTFFQFIISLFHSSLRILFSYALITLSAFLLFSACANIGTPSGGPRDENPPVLVSSSPRQGATNIDSKKITLAFDELVNVRDAFQKVIVSPTSKSTPRVSSAGKHVFVEFDSLAPNTTYTIDFGDAIEDNNEGNKLQSFAYSFSTGLNLDSLRISGYVLGARDLEPQQGMIVGVHANLNDSAFTSIPLLRVAKTDDRGRFSIRGLAPGNYRIFALGDNDNDFKYSSPEENLAFYDFSISPFSESTVALDSIYNPNTGLLDSVISRTRTKFLPNDILLRSFNSELRQQYLSKYERIDSTRIFLKFNTKNDSLPQISLIKPLYSISSLSDSNFGILEASQHLDSIVWWLSPELMRMDSLQFALTYPRSNPDLSSTVVTDTLNFITNHPRISKKLPSKKLSAKDSIAAVTTRFDIKSPTTLDVNKPIYIETPTPLSSFNRNAIHVSILRDSIYTPVTSRLNIISPDSLNPRLFAIEYPWDYASKYKLEIDSLAAVDIYGKPTRTLSQEFSTRQQGDYCSLTFSITGINDMPAFVELLGSGDAVKAFSSVVADEAYFPYLQPGKYYARIIIDSNSNGQYDTGNYNINLQPELAYYYPKAINIKKNWDSRVNWNIFDTPVDKMKPAAILKNRPAADKRNRSATTDSTEEEEEDLFDPNRNPFDPNYRSPRR